MSRTGRFNPRRPEKGRNRPNRPEHRIVVHGIRRKQPDLRRLGRAVITMALAEAEAEKAAADAKQATRDTDGTGASDQTGQEADHDE